MSTVENNVSKLNMDNLLSDFNRDGYVNVENFFNPDLMDELDHLIRSYFGDNPEWGHEAEFLQKSQTEVIPWFPQNQGVKAFDAIDENFGLNKLSQAILGDAWTSQYCTVMFSKKGTSGQAWHQDCPPDSASEFNLNRLVYTSDITDEVGG